MWFRNKYDQSEHDRRPRTVKKTYNRKKKVQLDNTSMSSYYTSNNSPNAKSPASTSINPKKTLRFNITLTYGKGDLDLIGMIVMLFKILHIISIYQK